MNELRFIAEVIPIQSQSHEAMTAWNVSIFHSWSLIPICMATIGNYSVKHCIDLINRQKEM